MPTLTVYDHITKNNVKTIFLCLLFPFAISILTTIILFSVMLFVIKEVPTESGGHLLNKESLWLAMNLTYSNLPIVLGWILSLTTLWTLYAFWRGDRMILSMTKASPLTRKEYINVYCTVQNVAITAGLPEPKMYIIDDDSLNAFTTGYSPKTASIALTKGAIEKLSPLELGGVIAHEMAHIGNRDIRLNLAIIVIMNVFVFLLDFVLRIFLHCGRNKNPSKITPFFIPIIIALFVFNLFLAPFLFFAISRTREYAADATGALLTRNPHALASALRKISNDAHVEVLADNKSMATACIADPYAKHLLFSNSTHPPIKQRISRLEKMA